MSMSGSDAYDGNSSMSSPGSELSYDHTYHSYDAAAYPLFPPSGSPGFIMSQANPVPVELIDDFPQEDGKRRRRGTSTTATKDTSYNNSRRRAQNRASQRAFRDRKEKHVKDLESRLRELEDKNQTLEQAYADLTNQHSRLKREMDVLAGKAVGESKIKTESDLDAVGELYDEDADGEFERILDGDLGYPDSYSYLGGQLFESTRV
ncbi:MAG: hypothetical protein M1838_002685 [Thelocarpon superellum]|nr:MAG: hypothetical protein M1838_002685 [Thelocarpon superellum]